MLGHIMEWFYGDLAGIRCDPGSVAFRKIIIRPTPVGDVTWAKATYHSANGTIASSWKRAGERFTLELTIPPNTTATVYIPAKDATSLTESGAAIAEARGVRDVHMEQGTALCEVVSGRYAFGSHIPAPPETSTSPGP